MKFGSVSLGLVGTLAALAAAQTTNSPSLTSVSMGTETPAWAWKSQPASVGSYSGDNSKYTLTGNGNGLYFCWDRAAVGILDQIQAVGNFSFTAHMTHVGASMNSGMAGIFVKSGLDTKVNVISIRWDYYWAKKDGDGLTWFNRQTPAASIGVCDKCEKGDMVGTTKKDWEGCLGEGFENRILGYKNSGDIWMRIQRQGDIFNLYTKTGSGDWKKVPDTSAGTQWEGGALPPHQQTFKLPDLAADKAAIVGVFVGDAQSAAVGATDTAVFDNIAYTAEGGVRVLTHNGQPQGLWKAFARQGGIALSMPEGATAPKSAVLFDLSGKRVGDLSGSGSAEMRLASGQGLRAGMYWLELRDAAGQRQVLPLMAE